jgi:AcrR family transcriptional regulator
MLLMRSAPRRSDDLTARARIRDAAVELIGRDGFDAVKIRSVAEHAGVSPGLVIHHFGTKEGLRAACEEYVGDRIHEAIEQAVANVQPYDLLGQMSKKLELAPLVPYLLRALAEGGDLGRRMFGRVVDDTERYLRAAVAQGAIRPSQDERGRAEMLASFSLGSQFLAQYLVSAETPEGRVEELQRRFVVPALEVFTQGLYTSTEIMDGYRDQLRRGDADAPVGSPGRPRRTEPNAPAGDPPGREGNEQVPPPQPAA